MIGLKSRCLLLLVFLASAQSARSGPEWVKEFEERCKGLKDKYYVDIDERRCCKCSPCRFAYHETQLSCDYPNQCTAFRVDCVYEEEFDTYFPLHTTMFIARTEKNISVTERPEESTIPAHGRKNDNAIIAIVVATGCTLVGFVVFVLCKTKCIKKAVSKLKAFRQKPDADTKTAEVPQCRNSKSEQETLLISRQVSSTSESSSVVEVGTTSEEAEQTNCNPRKDKSVIRDSGKSIGTSFDPSKSPPLSNDFEMLDNNHVRRDYSDSHPGPQSNYVLPSPAPVILPNVGQPATAGTFMSHFGSGNIHVGTVNVTYMGQPVGQPGQPGSTEQNRPIESHHPSSFEGFSSQDALRPCFPSQQGAGQCVTSKCPTRAKTHSDSAPRQHDEESSTIRTEFSPGSQRYHRQSSNISSTSTGAVENEVSTDVSHMERQERRYNNCVHRVPMQSAVPLRERAETTFLAHRHCPSADIYSTPCEESQASIEIHHPPPTDSAVGDSRYLVP